MKFGGSLARNIDCEVANFQALLTTRRKMLIFNLPGVKIGGNLARNARLMLRRVSFRACGFDVFMGEAAKLLVFEGVKM